MIDSAAEHDFFFFVVPSLPVATAMRGQLADEGWAVDFGPRRWRLFRRRKWTLAARRPAALSPVGDFEALVAHMKGLARRHGALLEAWGLPNE